jgi:mannitol-specific phosphotransferase system IIBC component
VDAPVSGAFNTILNAGVLGAVVIIFAAVIVVLWRHFIAEREALLAVHRSERDDLLRQLRETEAKHRQDLHGAHQSRVSDAESIQRQMFEVVRQCTAVMESTAAALNVHKDVATEHREAQKEAAEELRRLSSLLASLSEEIRARTRSR